MDIKQHIGHVTGAGQGVRVGGAGTGSPREPKKPLSKFFRASLVTLLYSGTILVIALLALTYFGQPNDETAKAFVNPNRYQAVFLNGGQVYFGNITELNNNHLTLRNIFYLQVDQQVQPKVEDSTKPNDVTLVKLGCELHGPEDLMVIKQDQVLFWENLKTDGQVSKSIEQFSSQNPSGIKCQTTNSPESSE